MLSLDLCKNLFLEFKKVISKFLERRVCFVCNDNNSFILFMRNRLENFNDVLCGFFIKISSWLISDNDIMSGC